MIAVAAALVAVSIPVLAVQPSPAVNPGRGHARAAGPETAVSVTGTVRRGSDADGRRSYTLTAGGTTWTLTAGPSWFWGDAGPLEAFVGESVTIAGTTRGDDVLDVASVDGVAIREPGKPPWAGGPWVVGESHPGWKDWMADGKPGNGHGRDGAPGQQKDKPSAP
jgi:hypothetical protein